VTQSADHIGDDLLSTLVDDQLTPDEAERVRAHLARCAACQERLEEFRSVAALLRGLPELEPPRDFSLGPRLVADPPNVIRLRRWYVVARTSAATLAAAFVFLSVGALYVDSRPAAGASIRVSTSGDASAPRAPEVAPPPTTAPAAVRAAAPASAPGAAAPAAVPAASPAVGAAAAARPAPGKPQPDDQVAAATSINPLPTLPPTPQPTAVALSAPSTVSNVPPDPAAPLRNAALGVGILAVLTLLAALAVRHRLRQSASHF
jgi:anti-sigma factor RsiW